MRLDANLFAVGWSALFAALAGCAADPIQTVGARSPDVATSCVTAADALFELDRVGPHDAVFTVVRCGATRNRVVRVEDDRDIRLAVVRRIIDIIRETHPAEFAWRSGDRTLTQSAKPADQPALEAFLLGTFFPQDPRAVPITSLTKDRHSTLHKTLPPDP